MFLARLYYKKIKHETPPYYADYPLLKVIAKPFRKFLAQVVAPNCPFNLLRVQLYRMAGFKIGRKVFIGMKCYIDDIEPKKITIEDGAIISFGVCLCIHGRAQKRIPLTIKKNAYIGCRATILAHRADSVGGGV